MLNESQGESVSENERESKSVDVGVGSGMGGRVLRVLVVTTTLRPSVT